MHNINVIIIGNGHYSTGMTAISDISKTDKDSGVLLPATLALKSEGIVGQIGIAARDGEKLLKLKDRISSLKNEFGWQHELKFYPNQKQVDEKAYLNALSKMPKPCVALIAVPDFLHKEVMLECIKREVPFLIVKPAVSRLDDFYYILEKMNKKAIFGMVDYHKVFDEANILLKAEYQSGEYGKINHVYSLMTQRRDMLKIYQRWLEKDNCLNINHYLGSHYIHLVGYITRAEPIDVRATSQLGYAAALFHRDVADLIETQIRWKDKSGYIFTSYHISGWNDPQETESMTFQEIHLLCEKGHVDSDQRYRGFRKVTSGKGYEALNPYFFNLACDPLGKINLNTKYGYLSIKSFIQATIDIYNGKKTVTEFDQLLPTLRESEKVTAILEAADQSLKCNSKIVEITKRDKKYILR